jgi:hypothetical protein
MTGILAGNEMFIRKSSDNMCKLSHLIEIQRLKMILLAKREGLTSSRTVQCSQQLDKLLNEQQKQLNQKLKAV